MSRIRFEDDGAVAEDVILVATPGHWAMLSSSPQTGGMRLAHRHVTSFRSAFSDARRRGDNVARIIESTSGKTGTARGDPRTATRPRIGGGIADRATSRRDSE